MTFFHEKTFGAGAACCALLALLTGCSSRDDAADFARGVEAYAARDLSAAYRAFARAAEKNPTNAAARVQLAMVAYDLGEPAKADEAARAARALRGDSAEAALAEANAAYLKKDYARAKALYTLVASEKSLPAPLRSLALASRAVTELTAEETVNARLSLLRAMRLDRRNPVTWYHLALLSRDTYHYDAAALEQFEMYARLAPADDPRARNTVRTAIPRLRDAVARSMSERPGVSKRDPALAAKLLAEGEELLKTKNPRNAGKKFLAAYAADPLSYPAALAAAKQIENDDRTSRGVDAALAAYAAASAQRPSSQATYLAAARLALRNGRFATAADILSRSLAHEPENKTVVDMLIETLRKSGRSRAAEAAAWQAYRKEL